MVSRCERCGSPRCVACENECLGCPVLERIRAVLRGGPDPDAPSIGGGDLLGDEKTHYFVRTLGREGRDVLVAPHTIAVRAIGDPRRHDYLARGGPYVLSELMQAMQIRALERPLVGLAPRGVIWKRVRPVAAADELVWLLPLPRGVELRLRPPHEEPPSHPIPIPDEGALALPEPWSRPPPPAWRFVDSDPPGRQCPHCSMRATRHRAAGDDALVCAACGRSFERRAMQRRAVARDDSPDD